jgi:ABC-type nitrate/sulfonate/bicarbonate transport system permease component
MTKKFYFYFLVPIVIILIWQVASSFVNPLFLSPPIETFLKIGELLTLEKSFIFKDLFATFSRLLIGYIISIVIGVTVGLFLGYSKRIYNAFEFIIDFFRSIPVTALFPIFLLLFGIGNTAKIAIVAWACSFIILINTMYGVHSISRTKIKVGQVFNITKKDLFTKIIFPESLPSIFAGMRTALSLGLIVAVFTEMFIGTRVGLGHRIINAQLLFLTSEIYALIIIIGLLGYILNKVFLSIENRVVHWNK